MKLVVMIPTKNEQETIANVIDEIPKEIDGIDEIEVLIIDGASTDNTIENALAAGAVAAYSDQMNRGLASAFKVGIRLALDRGADIIVNTDADMQYDQKEIAELVQPILKREADMVLGSRFKGEIEDMPAGKKFGNRLATRVTSVLAGQKISDAQSGFRAIHRELAERLIIEARKTYVQETLIRAIRGGYTVVEIPIHFRKRKDESRLIGNIWSYAFQVFPDLFLTYSQVAPLRFFGNISLILLLLSTPIIEIGFVYILLGLWLGAAQIFLSLLSLLLPSILVLLSAGVVMDYLTKIRKWPLDINAIQKHPDYIESDR